MAEYLPAQLERTHKPQVESEAPTKKERAPAPHPLVSLQSRAGNQAVARMVQRAGEEEELAMKHDPALQREESAESEDEELAMKHDPALQREESAESEDEELAMKHDAALQREEEDDEDEDEEVAMKHDPALQRQGEEEEIAMKRDEEQTVGLEGGPVGEDIQKRIDGMRGGGSAAPDGLRRQMEAATGADLSGVRVHQGEESSKLNEQLTAKAFTTGSDIFLREDQSPSDSSLMAHEMAHVVQQSGGRMAAGSGGGMTAGAANDPQEAQADELAHQVLSGTAARETDEARV
jgi:hypothetical protein